MRWINRIFFACFVFGVSSFMFSSCGEYKTVLKDGEIEIVKYLGKEKNIVIPEFIKEKRVAVIGEKAFGNKELESVVIPEGVIAIGGWAFSGNNLEILAIPGSVTSIGEHSFSHNKLKTLEISSGVVSIGNSAFYKNQLETVIIPDSVTSIGENAFGENLLTNVALSKGIVSIRRSAFSNNQLTNVIIPDSVISIGDFAFSSNQLASVTISNNVTSIGDSAFSKNQLKNIRIPNKNAAIGEGAFDETVLVNGRRQPVFVSAHSILKDYADNPINAERKWGGKEVVISGAINQVERDMFGRPVIYMLDDDMASFNMESLHFIFPDNYSLSKYKARDRVRIKGWVGSNFLAVNIINCSMY